MQILEKSNLYANICGIELAFNGELLPANIPGWQEFYNSMMIDIDFNKTYIGLGSVSLSEESKEADAGTSYNQKLTIKFPNADKKRSERIALMHKVKFIKVKMNTGNDIIIGRNDYKQNARLKIVSKSNQILSEITFECNSIYSLGYVATELGLPGLIPLILI